MNVKIIGLEEITDMLNNLNSKVDILAQPAADHWLDNDDFVKYLKISKKTAQHYRDKGLIGFSQVGSKIYYKQSDINQFLESHAIKRFSNRR